MSTIIIISILLITAVVAVCVLYKRGKSEVPQNTGVPVSGGAQENWTLTSLPTGVNVTISNKQYGVNNIVLVYNGTPQYNYSYEVDFDYSFVGGEASYTDKGKVGIDTTFKLNKTNYYGVILAGGPNAEIATIRTLKIK